MRLPKHGLLSLLHRPWLKTLKHRAQRVQQPFSTIVSPEPSHVTIPVGASGIITLDIHPPLNPSPSTPILIYLPPGPLLPSHAPQFTPLGLGSPLTVVRINYRLTPTQPYPLPIHDALAGYDWVVQHLVRGAGAHNGWQSTDGRVSGVAICGELIGGGLAAMLACTEGRVGRVGHVKAVVVGGPVVDWTGMFPVEERDGEGKGAGAGANIDRNGNGTLDVKGEVEGGVGTTKKRTAKTRTKPDSWRDYSNHRLLPASTLLHARDTLFAKPEHYHDPFASPLLFFRTASSDIPSLDPSPTSLLDPLDPNDTSDSNTEAIKEATLIDFICKRRAHRRHPPLGSGLILPRARVDVGRESVLRDQGVEFVESMRRSVGVSERGRIKLGEGAWEDGGFGGGNEGMGREMGKGEERIELRELQGVGFWTEEEMVGVGEWAGRVMRARE